MDNTYFTKILFRRLDLTKNVLHKKGIEYTTKTGKEDDRLINFRIAAQLHKKPTTPEQALMGMVNKHLASLIVTIEELDSWTPTQEYIDEKIGDIINYLILLEALLEERRVKEDFGV